MIIYAFVLIYNILHPYTLYEYMDKFRMIIYHINNKQKGGSYNVKTNKFFRNKIKRIKQYAN